MRFKMEFFVDPAIWTADGAYEGETESAVMQLNDFIMTRQHNETDEVQNVTDSWGTVIGKMSVEIEEKESSNE